MAAQIGKLKIGGEKRWKIIAAAVLGCFALFMVARMLVEVFGPGSPPPAPANVPARPATSSAANTASARGGANNLAKSAAVNGSKSLDPTLRFDLLARSESVEYAGTGRNVFSLEAPPPPMPKPVAPIRPAAPVDTGPPPPPPKPPINLTFYGYESAKGGAKRVFLINPNQDVFIAGEGDIVDKRYKVMKITATSVDIQDILNDNTQTIRLAQQAG